MISSINLSGFTGRAKIDFLLVLHLEWILLNWSCRGVGGSVHDKPGSLCPTLQAVHFFAHIPHIDGVACFNLLFLLLCLISPSMQSVYLTYHQMYKMRYRKTTWTLLCSNPASIPRKQVLCPLSNNWISEFTAEKRSTATSAAAGSCSQPGWSLQIPKLLLCLVEEIERLLFRSHHSHQSTILAWC